MLASALILLAALLHAVVNTLIKVSDDGLITRGCMNAVAFMLSVGFLAIVPFPDADLWMLLLISVLIHGLYPFFLVEAYRSADLSAAYPLARGSAPMFVVLLGVTSLDISLTPNSVLGITLISLAVASLAFERPSSAKDAGRRTASIAAALATGLIVAAYTMVDAIGLRLAPSAFTYIVWLFVLDGAFVACAVALARRRTLVPFIVRHWKSQLIAGVLGVLTYGTALIALGMGPIAQIAALRETSILFAALIGAFVLGEPVGTRRLFAAAIAVVGIVLMHTGVAT